MPLRRPHTRSTISTHLLVRKACLNTVTFRRSSIIKDITLLRLHRRILTSISQSHIVNINNLMPRHRRPCYTHHILRKCLPRRKFRDEMTRQVSVWRPKMC